jgi:hypothetical protein
MIDLEKLSHDLKMLTARKEEIHQAFHQISGAIDILQQYIKSLTETNTPEEDDSSPSSPININGTLTEQSECED